MHQPCQSTPFLSKIALIRKELRLADEEAQQFIITTPKKGYSLSNNVTIEGTEGRETIPPCTAVLHTGFFFPSKALRAGTKGDAVSFPGALKLFNLF